MPDPDPTNPDPTNEPKYLTAEDAGNMITGAVKRQVGAAFADFTKQLPNVLGEQLKTALPGLLKELKIEPPPEGDPPKGAPKVDPEIAALKSKIDTLTQANEAERKAREEAELKSKNDGAKAALRTALGSRVRAEVLDDVVDLLFDGRKVVSFDEQNRPLFTVKKSPYAGAAEEDMPLLLADGVDHWLKSESAKHYLPAPGSKGPPVQGGPKGPPKGPQLPVYDKPATTMAEKIRRATERAEAHAASQQNQR